MTKLTIGEGRVLDTPTARLRDAKKLPLKSDGTQSGAVYSAAGHARRAKKTAWVYRGNAYMRAIWRVTFSLVELTDPTGNDGTRVFSVDPDLTVREHPIDRSGGKAGVGAFGGVGFGR